MEYSEGDARIDGVKIHYYRTGGDKPPLVLLHGATDNGLCWMPVAEKLVEKHNIIMPDAQGHGQSDRLGPDSRMADHVNQTMGLIRELNLTKPVIMGHSMGAGTAAGIAVAFPESPRAIVLEDPAWGHTDAEIDQRAAKEREAFMKALLGLRGLSLEEVIAKGRRMNPLWSEAEIRPWAIAKRQFDPALFSSMRPNLSSYEEQVPAIRCPTLLISAENGIVTAQTAERAATLWRSEKPFRSVRIKGAGHNIRRERYDEFMDAVNRFLADIPA